MPAPAGTTLSIRHRDAQRAIGRRVVAEVLRVWGVIDPSDVDRAWPLLSRTIAETIERGYTDSVRTAADYVRRHAAMNGVDLRTVLTAPMIDVGQLSTALRVTGPVAVKTAASGGATPANAVATAGVQLAGSATRLTLLGSRRTIIDTVRREPQILGYRRVGIGATCDFCAMLIGRGAVYKDESAAAVSSGGRSSSKQDPGTAFHDHCNCQAEPLYESGAGPLDIVEHLARHAA